MKEARAMLEGRRPNGKLQTTTGAMRSGEAPGNRHHECVAEKSRQTACNWLKRVQSAAILRFLERHVVKLEK